MSQKRDMGHPSSVQGEKYQRILDAAVAVIAERRYFNSPASAIADRAGVADGTIYLYFKNKAVFTGGEYDAQVTAAQVVDVVLNGVGVSRVECI